MPRASTLLSVSVLFFTTLCRAESARDGSPVAAQQQVTSDVAPNAEPNATPPGGDMSRAPAPPVRFTNRPLSVSLVVGAGTIVGGLGGVVEYSIAQRFALSAGVGASWVGEHHVLESLQAGALGRFRLALSEGNDVAQAFDLVGGFSTGNFMYPIFPGDGPSWSGQAYWVQLGLGYELMTRSGFRLTTGLGAAILAVLDQASNALASSGYVLDDSKLPRLFFAADLGVGYAL